MGDDMNLRLYRFMRCLASFYVKVFYRVEFVNKENIPLDGKVILAGNHKNNLDCIVLGMSTKRVVHFLAKKELIDGKFSFIFKKLGIIPVDRSKKNKEALEEGIKVLNNDDVIGIFPESTFNKSEYVVLPFKMGAVKMAASIDAPIVPFAIVGDYKIFQKKVKIIFDKPYYVKDKLDLRKENITLMNKVIKLIKDGNN